MINLKEIPKGPGCYLFKDKSGKIIYIGKAKDLSKRVTSYFQNKDHDVKTKHLVKNISAVEFFITDSEIDALLLENNLIKKHKPKYNIDLKDSKRYAYIQITPEEYPRILVSRKRESRGKNFGPFVSAAKRDHVLQILQRTFKIRTCRRLPKKECIRYSLGLCSAPCINKISKKDYLENVGSAEMILRGKTKNLSKILFSKMKEAASKLNFEKALEYKNQLSSLKYLKEKQIAERQKNYDEDIINYIISKDIVYTTVFNSRKGILENKQSFEIDRTGGFFAEFLKRYYSENSLPKELILPEEIDPSIKNFLEKIKKKKLRVVIPKSGEKKKLLELVKKNLSLEILGGEKRVEDLRRALNLNDAPNVIECFDISHLSGTKTVASMVQFNLGKPNKQNYRRFRIRSHTKNDDYASLKEVVRRRYSKLLKENLRMPDLVIIDGGKGQLSSCLGELGKLGVALPIISIAKREEEIFLPGKSSPVILKEKSLALNLVKAIRDEAHRFAISYNRLLRKKEMLE